MLETPTLSIRPPQQARAVPSGHRREADFDTAYEAAQPSPAPVFQPTTMREWLAASLDEIDYGVLVVSRDARVMHVNHAARAELDAEHPLALRGDELRARRPADAALLRDALHSALRRGLRKLLTFDDGAARISVSVVPLHAQGADRRSAALLLLGKRSVCEDLSVQCYARDHRLTPAEARVLAALCRGGRPHAIAAEFGVAISTVRTQIGSIRAKTGADSIRALVRTVATLPPLMGVLRPAANRHAA